MTDTRCHCTRHTTTTETTGCSRYQVMNTAHLFPVLAAIARDHADLCERGTVGEIPTAVGAVPLTDLAAYLTCPRTCDAERDAVWRHVIEHCRRPDADAEAWKRAALGLALPRLIHIALRARDRNHIRPAETDEMLAEMLAAFTHALATVDLAPDTGDPITWRLARAAAAGAQKMADRHTAHRRRVTEADDNLPEPGVHAHAHARPSHPDLALARLVAAGTISALEADLIGRHRIEHVTLRRLCTEHGWYPMQATRALRAAETKVARALQAEAQY